MDQKHPFEKQQKSGMIVAEYQNITAPGTYLTSRLDLISIPDFALRQGHSPVIGQASKQKLWTLKLTDKVLNVRIPADLAEARQLAQKAGITEVNF